MNANPDFRPFRLLGCLMRRARTPCGIRLLTGILGIMLSDQARAQAFQYTTNAGKATYSSLNGVLFDKARITLVEFPSGYAGADALPDCVTRLGSGAFISCKKLTRTTIPDRVTTIDGLPGTQGWERFGTRPTSVWSLPNPVILAGRTGFGPQPAGFSFRISWATNLPVVVEMATDSKHPARSPVGTNLLAEGAASFSDPRCTDHPAGFYRVRPQ